MTRRILPGDRERTIRFNVSIFPAFEAFGFWEQLAKLEAVSPDDLKNVKNHFNEGLRLASTATLATADAKPVRYAIPYTNTSHGSPARPLSGTTRCRSIRSWTWRSITNGRCTKRFSTAHCGRPPT